MSSKRAKMASKQGSVGKEKDVDSITAQMKECDCKEPRGTHPRQNRHPSPVMHSDDESCEVYHGRPHDLDSE